MLLLFIACNDGTLNTKNINVNPEVMVILPDSNDGGEVEAGTEVLFLAVVSDADPDDQNFLEARWRVDNNPEPVCDYVLVDENGENSCTILIEEGMEKVTVEVKDPQNAVGTDEYLLSIYLTEAPLIELLNPQSDGMYQEGLAIEFEALVEDAEDPAEELTVTWNSDLEGDMDIGGTVSPLGFVSAVGMLNEGVHLITATVIDSTGKTGNATVEISVGPLSVPIIDFVDIQNTGGVSIDEAFDGQTIVCGAGGTDPEGDPLTWAYQWHNAAGTEITSDSTNNILTLNYATQSLTAGELVTCTATATDGQTSSADSDTVVLVDCSPFATEIPYDGIDSNCDGLETLNDQNGDGVPDTDEDFDADDDVSNAVPDVPPRLGVECLGEPMNTSNGTVYFLICDNDHYWKTAHDFCIDNGYDSLATLRSDAEFQFVSNLLVSSRDDYTKPDGSNRNSSTWLGLTRGPDCAPVTNSNMPYTSVCGSGTSNYFWIDNSSNSWINSSHWISGEGNNTVEHCAMLLYSNSGDLGFYDLYCDYVGANPHSTWSIQHTLPSMCVKRQ